MTYITIYSLNVVFYQNYSEIMLIFNTNDVISVMTHKTFINIAMHSRFFFIQESYNYVVFQINK